MFVTAVTGRFQLERRVRYVEVPGQARLEFVERLRRMAVVEALVVDHHVGGSVPGVPR